MMIETLSSLEANLTFHSFFMDLAGGNITLVTSLLLLVLAAIFSFIGGAIGGIILAGKDLGYQLSAMMGSLLGPAGVIPAALIGLILLK